MRSGPIIIESINPLQLPAICARCGKVTTNTINTNPSDPSKASLNFMLEGLGTVFHPLGVALMVKRLNSAPAKIPICKSCGLKHFLPSGKTLVFIVMHVLFFIAAFYHGFKTQFGDMALYLLLAMLCLVLVALKNSRHDFETLPVRVFLRGDKFRYVIYSGPLYSHFAEKQIAKTPENIRSL